MAANKEEEPIAVTFAKELAEKHKQSGTVVVTTPQGTIEKIIHIRPSDNDKQKQH